MAHLVVFCSAQNDFAQREREDAVRTRGGIVGRVAVALLLVAVLALSGALVSCKSTATIKVTLKDMAGGALAGITMAVGDKTATSNASGLVTVEGVTPGQVTLKFTGGGFDTQKAETVKKGDNEFTYQLSPAFAFRNFGDIQTHRMRVTAPGLDEPMQAVFVRGVGTHWTMQDGIQLIHLGDVLYFKAGPNERWQRFAGSGQLGESLDGIAGLANRFLGDLQGFDTQLADGSIQAQWLRNEEANGYQCSVFTVSWSDNSNSGSYTVYVVASGDAKGFVTRYESAVEGIGATIYDIWDINTPLTVEAPG